MTLALRPWLVLAVFVVGVGLGNQGPATAAELAAENASEPAAEEPAAAEPLAPAADWPTLTSLLKLPDWVQLGLNIESDLLGNPGGGTTRKGNWIQQTTLDASFSSGHTKPVGRWQEADHWSAHLQLTQFSGTSGYGESIGTAFPITATDHPIGLWLTEASVERHAGNGTIDFKTGLFSLNPGFVEAPVLDAYVNSVFNDLHREDTFDSDIWNNKECFTEAELAPFRVPSAVREPIALEPIPEEPIALEPIPEEPIALEPIAEESIARAVYYDSALYPGEFQIY